MNGAVNNLLAKLTATQGLLGFPEFEAALDLWDRVKEQRPKMQTIMQKYDTSAKGYLSKDDLSDMLTDMNGGTPPSHKEVVMVCCLIRNVSHACGVKVVCIESDGPCVRVGGRTVGGRGLV